MIACATGLVVSLAAQIQRPNVPLGNDLVYVADLGKTGQSGSEAELFMAADVGFISENVYRATVVSETPLTLTDDGLIELVFGTRSELAAKSERLGRHPSTMRRIPGMQTWPSPKRQVSEGHLPCCVLLFVRGSKL